MSIGAEYVAENDLQLLGDDLTELLTKICALFKREIPVDANAFSSVSIQFDKKYLRITPEILRAYLSTHSTPGQSFAAGNKSTIFNGLSRVQRLELEVVEVEHLLLLLNRIHQVRKLRRGRCCC